ncbi:MAG: hypothetical protein AAF713_20630 [Pseudomonadota bacterium]
MSTPLPPVIGLAGASGVGKSSVARAIIKSNHAGFALLPSNTAGYQMLDRLLAHHCDEQEAEFWLSDWRERPCPYLGGRTVREALQTLLTEWGRDQMGAMLWRLAWQAQADRLAASGLVIVNASVRFEDEAQAVRDRGGLVFLVTRAGMAPASAHRCENQVIRSDARVAVEGPNGVPAAARQILEICGAS